MTRRRVSIHPTTGQRYYYPYPIYYRRERRWVRVSRVIRRSVLTTTLKSTMSSCPDVVDSASARPPDARRRLSGLLSAAVKHPDPTALRCLVDRHAVDANTELVQPTVAFRRRKTRPLHAAIAADRRGLAERVDVLLGAGADPNCRDGRGNTPLHVATAASQAAAARLLLARRADPDMLDGRGETALHSAARQGHTQLVRALLDHGADQFIGDRAGLLPVHVAAAAGNDHIVEMLCSADQRAVEAGTRLGQRRPIHVAAGGGQVETVSLLTERLTADVACRDSDGNTPLHAVVAKRVRVDRDRDTNSYYACATELLRQGAAIDTRNAAGQTALALAAANEFPKIAQLLLANGAEPLMSTQLEAEAPPPKQRRIGKKKSNETLTATEAEIIAEHIRKKPSGTADEDGMREHSQSSQKVVSAADKRRKPSSRSEHTSPPDTVGPLSERVKLRKPQTSTSRPSVDNEISTFSVAATGSAERMCILLDQKPSPQDVDDRIRSRRSIEGEINRTTTSDLKHGNAKKPVAVESKTDKSVQQKPSSEAKQPGKIPKALAGASQQGGAVKQREKNKEKRKSKDRDSFVETREASKEPPTQKSKQSTQPKARGLSTDFQADELFLDPESGAQEWFGRPGAVSPVALKDVRKLSTPTFRSTIKSPSGFISEGGGMRGLKLRVAGVVPKAYNRRQKDAARRAFFAARPVGIESIGDADRDDISQVSMSSMPEIGYEVWERSVQRHQEWAEPLKPVYGKPPAHHGLNVSFPSSRSSPAPTDDKVLIGPYAPPYRSTGPIDVKTDAIEEMLQDDNLSYDYDSMEWNDDEIPEPQLDDIENIVPRPPPEILDRHQAVEELLRTSPTEYQGKEKVDNGEELKPKVKPPEKISLPIEKMEEDRMRKAEMDKAFEEAKKKLSQKPKSQDDLQKRKHDKKKRRTEESIETSKTETTLEEKEQKTEKHFHDKHTSKESHEVHFKEQEIRTVVHSSTVVSGQSSTSKIQKLTPENFVVTADVSTSEESEEETQAPSEQATANVIPPRTQTTPVKGILKSTSKYKSYEDQPQQNKDKASGATKIPVSKLKTDETKRRSGGSESRQPTLKETQQPVNAETKVDEGESGLQGHSEEQESAGRRQSEHSDMQQSKVSEEVITRRDSHKKDKERSRIPVPNRNIENQNGVYTEVTPRDEPGLKQEDRKVSTNEEQSTLPIPKKKAGSRRKKTVDDANKSTSHTGSQEQQKVSREDSTRQVKDKDTTQLPVKQRDVVQQHDSIEKSPPTRETNGKTTERYATEISLKPAVTEIPQQPKTETASDEEYVTVENSSHDAGSGKKKASDAEKQRANLSGQEVDKNASTSESNINVDYSEEPGSRRRKLRDVVQQRDSIEKPSRTRKIKGKTTERYATEISLKPAVTEIPQQPKTETDSDEEYVTVENSSHDASSGKKKASDAEKQAERLSGQEVDKNVSTNESNINVDYSVEPGSHRRKLRDVVQHHHSIEKTTPTRKTRGKTTERYATEISLKPAVTEIPHQPKTETASDEEYVTVENSSHDVGSGKKKASDAEKHRASLSGQEVDKNASTSESNISEDYSEEPGSRRRKLRGRAKQSELQSTAEEDRRNLVSGESSKRSSNADTERQPVTAEHIPQPNISSFQTEPSSDKKIETTIKSNKIEVHSQLDSTAGLDEQNTALQDHTVEPGSYRRGLTEHTKSNETDIQHRATASSDTASAEIKPDSRHEKKARKSSKGSHDDTRLNKHDSAVVPNTERMDKHGQEPECGKQMQTSDADVCESKLVEREADIVITPFDVDKQSVDAFERTGNHVERLGETVEKKNVAELSTDHVSEPPSHVAGDMESYEDEPGSKRRKRREKQRKKDVAQLPSSPQSETKAHEDDQHHATVRTNISATDKQVHEVVIEKAKEKMHKSPGDSELMQHWPKGPAIRPDVWEEAMNDEPLACSDVVYDDVVIPTEEMDLLPETEYTSKPTVVAVQKEKRKKPLVPRHERKKPQSPKLQAVEEMSFDVEIGKKDSGDSSSSSKEDKQTTLAYESSSSYSSDTDQEEHDRKISKKSDDSSSSFEEKESHGRRAEYEDRLPKENDYDKNTDRRLPKETDVDEEFGVDVNASTEISAQDEDMFEETNMDDNVEEKDENQHRSPESGIAAKKEVTKRTGPTLPTKHSGKKKTFEREQERLKDDDLSDYDIPIPGAANKVPRGAKSKQTAVAKEPNTFDRRRSKEKTGSTRNEDQFENDTEEMHEASDARNKSDDKCCRPTPNIDSSSSPYEPTWPIPSRPKLPLQDQQEQKQILPPKSLEDTRSSLKKQKRQTKNNKSIYRVQEAEQLYQRKIDEEQGLAITTTERVDQRKPSYDADTEKITESAEKITDIDVEESFEEWISDEDEIKNTKSRLPFPTVPTKETDNKNEVGTSHNARRFREGQPPVDEDIPTPVCNTQQWIKDMPTTRRETSYQETSFDDVEPESTPVILESTEENKSVDSGKQPQSKPASVPSSKDLQKKLAEKNQDMDDEEMFKTQHLKHGGKGRFKKVKQRKRLSDSLFDDPKAAGEQKNAGETAMIEDKPQSIPAPRDQESHDTHAPRKEQNIADGDIHETNLDELSAASANEEKDEAVLDRFDQEIDTESADTVEVEKTVEDDKTVGKSKSAEQKKKRTKEKKGGEQAAGPKSNINQLTFTPEKGEAKDSESDNYGDYEAPTVTVPQPQRKYKPKYDDGDYSDSTEQPEDGVTSLTLTEKETTTEEDKERASQTPKKTKKDSTAKKSKKDKIKDAETKKSIKHELPSTESGLQDSLDEDEDMQFKPISQSDAVERESDDTQAVEKEQKIPNRDVNETNLDELSAASTDEEKDEAVLDRFDQEIDTESADTVEVENTVEDDKTVGISKSAEQKKKRTKEKKGAEHAAGPKSNVNQLTFTPEKGEAKDSESDNYGDYEAPTVTVPQSQRKYKPKYDDGDYSDSTEQPEDIVTSLTLTEKETTTEEDKERASQTPKKTKKDSTAKKSKKDKIKDTETKKSIKHEQPSTESGLQDSLDEDEDEKFLPISQPSNKPHAQHKIQETNLDDEFERTGLDGESLELPVKQKQTIENGDDSTTMDRHLGRAQPGRTSRGRNKRHQRRSIPEPAVIPTMPLPTELDQPIDANGSVSSDGEQFLRVPQIPETRFSSKFSTEDVDDWSEKESEDTQALREQWEKDQRKMQSVFTNGQGHPRTKPVDSESDDIEVDDLSPSPEENDIRGQLSGDDSRQKTSDAAKQAGMISGPVRTQQDATSRPEMDRRRHEYESDDDEGEDGDDDNDERYRLTTTTTTTTTTSTTTRPSRHTTSERDIDTRRHRPRSTGDGRDDTATSSVEPVQRRRRRGRRRPRSVSFGASHRYVVSHDTPVELKPMTVPRPKLTLEEAAMQSVTNRVATQPRLHVRRAAEEPVIVYTRGIYRPQPVYWRGTADSQGFNFIHNSSQDSRTRDLDQTNEEVDEPDDDDDDSPGPGLDIEPLESSQQQRLETALDGDKSESDGKSAFVVVSPHHVHSLRRHLRSLRRSRKYVTAPAAGRREPAQRRPLISEPGPVDFSQYGVVARMWMEQVDMKTVVKSKTMYLSVMPAGSRPPDQLLSSFKYEAMPDSEVQLAQWIMVRERSLGRLKQKQRSSQSLGVPTDSVDLDVSTGPLSPSRRMTLFFQVGEKWKDLAWALFAGVHTDAETLRMITDIELKHPDDLSDQIQDMMSRWWKRKGNSATVTQLRDALDLIEVPYVDEDNVDSRPSFSTSFAIDSDLEELDVGEVTETDPNVSRLMHTYRTRSLNASYMADGSPPRRQETIPRDTWTDVVRSSDETNLARGSSLPAGRNRDTRKNVPVHNVSFPSYTVADSRPADSKRGRLATEDLSQVSYDDDD